MANQAIIAPMRALDENGKPVAGALAYFYQTGTAVLAEIVGADDGALENPLPADGFGIFVQVKSDVALRVIVTTPDGAALPGYPIDPVPQTLTTGSAASAITYEPTDSVPQTDVQAAVTYVGDAVSALDASLGTFATADIADRTLAQATWNAGTVTTEALISPAKLAGMKYQTGEYDITPGALLTVTHNLGVIPLSVFARLVCQSGEHGYSVGDNVAVSLVNNSDAANTRFNGVTLSGSQVLIRLSDAANVFAVGHKTTGAAVALTNASWKLKIQCVG